MGQRVKGIERRKKSRDFGSTSGHLGDGGQNIYIMSCVEEEAVYESGEEKYQGFLPLKEQDELMQAQISSMNLDQHSLSA